MKFSGGGGQFHEKAFKIALIVTSFISVLLMAIVLAAGTNGVLDQLHILRIDIDTSKAVQEASSDVASKASEACDKIPNLGPFGGDSAKDLCNKGVDGGKKVVDKVADATEISFFFSVHIGALCRGDLEDGKAKVETCTKKFHTGSTEISDFEPPFGLDVFKDIVEKGRDIPNKLGVVAYPVLAIELLLVLTFIFAIGVAFLERETPSTLNVLQRHSLLGAMVCAGLGLLSLVICASIITGVGEKVKDKLNHIPAIYAHTSPALFALLWASAVFTMVSLGMLFYLRIQANKGMSKL